MKSHLRQPRVVFREMTGTFWTRRAFQNPGPAIGCSSPSTFICASRNWTAHGSTRLLRICQALRKSMHYEFPGGKLQLSAGALAHYTGLMHGRQKTAQRERVE